MEQMVNEGIITLLLFIRLMNWEYDSDPGQRQHIINLGTGSDTQKYCDTLVNENCDKISSRIPTVNLKIPGKAFLKSETRISVTFKL